MAQATLTVWRFDTADGAGDAVATMEDLAGRGILSLHDAATVSWPPDARKPRTRSLCSGNRVGSLGGAFWGMLFGLIFFLPLLGAALGAVTGALTGCLADVGIDDGFINKIRDQVTPGTSALFVLSSDVVVDRVKDAFADHHPADLISTNLSNEQEAALRQVFMQE